MKKPLVPWSLLSAFGNTPLAKAVVFTPIVAGYVYYSGEYLRNQWGFQNALWMYWSLLFLSVGQLIYLGRAPREIKKHGDNLEDFVDKALRTWGENVFDDKALEYVSSFFSKADGGVLRLGPNEVVDPSHFQSTMMQFKRPDRGPDEFGGERSCLLQVVRGEPIRPGRHVYGFDPDKLAKILTKLQEAPIGDEQLAEIRRLSRFMNNPQGSVEWKKEVLQHSFLRAECTNKLSRYTTGFLFIFGSAYFAWNTLTTIVEMAKITILGGPAG